MSLLMDVGHFAAVGETVEGLGIETEPEGKGYNQAIAASRLDVDQALDMLHGFGAKNVIITMGGEGSVVSQAGKRFHVGALNSYKKINDGGGVGNEIL